MVLKLFGFLIIINILLHHNFNYNNIYLFKGLGFVNYVRDKMNLFDGFIVILSELDLFLIDALT